MCRFDPEELERRELLSSVTVEGRTLHIVGNNSTDCIDVSQPTGSAVITATVRSGGTNCQSSPIQQQVRVAAQTIDSVLIEALGGADFVFAAANKKTTIQGGDGNDTLSAKPIAGAGVFICGDAGNDVLMSAAGYLVGGDGDDQIYGGSFRDGGRGFDTVYGRGTDINCERWL